MKWLQITVILFCFQGLLLAQDENGHFLVEFDQFSPPTQDIVRNFEGRNAAPFLAPDIDGTQQFLGDYKGKNVIIWFWSIKDNFSLSQLPLLNLLQDKYKGELQIVSFASEDKQELLDFRQANPIDFPVIYKGDLFGEAAYAKDLGQGRLFYIDQQGKIKHAIPREALDGVEDRLYIILENIYNAKGL